MIHSRRRLPVSRALARFYLSGAMAVALSACARVAPPASAPPSAEAALSRMRATLACGRGVQGSAKIDHFGAEGRVRGDVLLFASRPARLRMDVVSPFGVALATLTTDGQRFSLSDLREKRFYRGPASACNIARLTTVAVPGRVLVDLLRGEAPVLRHPEQESSIVWDPAGYWLVSLRGERESREQIRLSPRPDDWAKPWELQRMRVLDVRVEQQGLLLYHAELEGQAPARMADVRVDPDNLEPPLPPSGPPCDAEVPRKIHVEVSVPASDVRFTYQDLVWNPPLVPGTFEQPVPPDTPVTAVDCP